MKWIECSVILKITDAGFVVKYSMKYWIIVWLMIKSVVQVVSTQRKVW